MEKLTDLPNIGPKLAEHLAGAVEGVRKSLLPPERRAELKNRFRALSR